MYGGDYYKGPRQYQTKVRNAQEAHEAIRPTEFRRTPQSLERVLEADELRIYDLIWKRAIASQMAEARMLRTTRRDHRARAPTASRRCSRRAARRSSLPGYLRAYVEGSDDPAAELDEQETLLPKLAVGEQIYAPDNARRAAHRRRARREGPPDDAAGALHRSVAGQAARRRRHRPSVHLRADRRRPFSAAATSRGRARRWCPSFTAFAVTRLLREHFGDYVDLGFTAEMEEILDEISNGEKDWLDFIREFYRGDGKHHGLENLVEDKEAGDRLPGDRRLRGSRARACRCASASAATVRSFRSARRATKGRARRCPTISRRRI